MEIFLPSDDACVALEPDLETSDDSVTSTEEPTNSAQRDVPGTTHAQGEDNLPEPHSSPQERVPAVNDQEANNTARNRSQSPHLHEESVDLIMMAFKTQHVAHLSHNSSNLHSPLMYLSPKDRSCSQSMRDYADYPFSVST